MEEQVNGRISFIGIETDEALEKLAEERMRTWVAWRRFILLLPEDAEYKVLMRKLYSNELIYCQVQVRISNAHWGGSAVSDTCSEAFEDAVRNLSMFEIRKSRATLEDEERTGLSGQEDVA